MLAAPDFSNYTAAEWDAERVWILSLDKQTEPLSWIYRGLQVARSITSTLNVAVNTWNQQIHHMMAVVAAAPTVWLWWSHVLFRVMDASLSIISVFVKLSSASPLEGPLASCFLCWDVPYQCMSKYTHTHTQSCKSRHFKSKLLHIVSVKHVYAVIVVCKPLSEEARQEDWGFIWISSVSVANTGLCSSSSSTSSHRSHTASRGGWWMTQIRQATPAKSWPSSSQRASSSRRSAFPSSSRELKS